MRHLNWTAAGAFVAGLTFAAAPATAQDRWTDPGFMAAANVTVHRGNEAAPFDHPMAMVTGTFGNHHRGDRRRHDGRRGRRDNDGFFGGWAWYDPYINRSWDSDSYNDWWHDRPDRAYPRWVQHNDGCDEARMWQGGGAWRCNW